MTHGQWRLGFTPQFIASAAWHAVLPIMAIVLTSMGGWSLGMRGMMITTDGEDYMILAQAKGLRPSRLFSRYAVRNAMLPQLTALALTLGLIVGGNILVETYFAYPGMGYLLVLRHHQRRLHADAGHRLHIDPDDGDGGVDHRPDVSVDRSAHYFAEEVKK